MRPIDHTPVRLNVYVFDHALFKSPVPNPELYTADTLQYLLDRSDVHHLCWYRSAGILSHGLAPFESEDDQFYNPWNEDLVEMVKEDMADPDRVPVLYCDRFHSEMFEKIVHEFTEMAAMEFFAVKIGDGRYSLQNLLIRTLESLPNCAEVSLYAADDAEQDKIIKDFMEKHHRNIDYFREKCAFQSCMLNPSNELRLVNKMINQYMAFGDRQVRLTETNEGVVLKFPLEETQRLLRVAFNGQEFTPDKGVVFSGKQIHLCDEEHEDEIMRRFFRGPGDEVTVYATEMGYKDNLYAIRFKCRRPDLAESYAGKLVAVVAHDKGTELDTIRDFGSIDNWWTLDKPRGVCTFHPIVEINRRWEITEHDPMAIYKHLIEM